MKTLYLECAMGAAGDMLSAALLELFPDPDEMLKKLNAFGIPGVVFSKERVLKCGIAGTHISVSVDGAEEHEDMHAHGHAHTHDEHHAHHHHSSLHDIEHMVTDHLRVSDVVKRDVLGVYKLIAEAEGHVHGVPVTEIHFHEVGTMDAVADITAVCFLMRELSPDQVVASPVRVGSGSVKCAHGILPVPAPATAHLLRGIPIYGGDIPCELCTPTGAALLKRFVTRFGAMPVMSVGAIGYGMGTKDLPQANCLRAMLGESEDAPESILQLSCNIDDMTAEELGCAMERLFEAGALDVFTTPIGMKKCRPGTLLSVICDVGDREKLIRAVFRHTSTLGVRENVLRRYVLARSVSTVETSAGSVRKKVASGYGVERVKYEYDDVARIAGERNISLAAARKLLDDGKL